MEGQQQLIGAALPDFSGLIELVSASGTVEPAKVTVVSSFLCITKVKVKGEEAAEFPINLARSTVSNGGKMETTFQILQSPVVTCQAVRYPVTLILSDSSSIRFRCITEKQAETLVRAIKGIERPPLPAPWSQADLKHVEPVAREFRSPASREWNDISAAARLAVDKGDFINAEVLYAQAVRKCRESTVGTAEEGVIRREFSNVLVRLDKLPRAEQEMKACVAIFVDTYGEVHPLTGEVLAELAALQFQISDPDALVTSQRTVACLRAALGGTHSNTAQALFNLGNVAATQENHALAIESYSSALDSFRVNNQHEEAGQAAQALAVNHKKRSEFVLAAKYYSEVSEEYREAFGPNDKRTVDAAKRAADASAKAKAASSAPAAPSGDQPPSVTAASPPGGKGKGKGKGKK